MSRSKNKAPQSYSQIAHKMTRQIGQSAMLAVLFHVAAGATTGFWHVPTNVLMWGNVVSTVVYVVLAWVVVALGSRNHFEHWFTTA